ncbi:MAG: hypothetical protein SGPRY_002342, partial [Prymnesium sp.]
MAVCLALPTACLLGAGLGHARGGVARGARVVCEELDAMSIDSFVLDAAPTFNQLSYATKLSKRLERELPDEARSSSTSCSNFINEALSLLPPTQKQLAFAGKLAEANNVDLPKSATESSAAISEFIEFMKAESTAADDDYVYAPPTEKQLAFASKLAESKGIELTETDTSSADAISRFIDEHKGDQMDNGAEYPPTDKQLSYAQRLSERAGLELPEEALRDSQACSNFIDEALSIIPPTQKQIAFATKLAEENNVFLPTDATESSAAISRFIDMHMGGTGTLAQNEGALPTQKQLAYAIRLALLHRQDLSYKVECPIALRDI